METTAADRTLSNEISAIDGVDKVFGRMEQTDVSASYGNGAGTLTLISYNDRRNTNYYQRG